MQLCDVILNVLIDARRLGVVSHISAADNNIITVGGGRGGEKTVKDDAKSGSKWLMWSRDKAVDEAMDWEGDTNDVLEQLLRDDVCN